MPGQNDTQSLFLFKTMHQNCLLHLRWPFCILNSAGNLDLKRFITSTTGGWLHHHHYEADNKEEVVVEKEEERS